MMINALVIFQAALGLSPRPLPRPALGLNTQPLPHPLSLGVVLVTSAARSNPNTEIIWSTIDSLSLFEGLSQASIVVVCDGCRAAADLEPEHAARLAERLAVDPCLFSKRGIVSDAVARAYEGFKDQLQAEVAAHPSLKARLSLLRLNSHYGFALAVREGLLLCRANGLRHAMVVQHDRGFIRRVRRATLRATLDHFEAHPSCRYVGFPSGTSKSLASRARRRRLECRHESTCLANAKDVTSRRRPTAFKPRPSVHRRRGRVRAGGARGQPLLRSVAAAAGIRAPAVRLLVRL